MKDGEGRTTTAGEILCEDSGPRRARGEFFQQHAHNSVTTETDSPDEVVFRRGVVDDGIGLPGGGDAGGPGHHVLLEAAAAN